MSTHPPGPIPTLMDDAVTLRGLRQDDAGSLVAQAGEPDTARWTSAAQPFTSQDAVTVLAAAAAGWAQGTRYSFAIEFEGRFAGSLNLRRQGPGLAEVGFTLMTWARGRGVMTRALRLAITWAFSQTGIEILQWKTEVGNWPSRRVAWAVGFTVGPAVPGLLERRGERADGWIGTLRRGARLQPAHAWLDPVRISGDQVILREHREEDVERLVEACRDAETLRWLSHLPEHYSAEDAGAHLLRIQTDEAAGRSLFWVMADPDDDRMLGEIMIFVLGPQVRQAEVGYLTHPDARGRGVTTEAVRLAVRHALIPVLDGGLGLHRILLRAAEGNLGSQRVAEKNGFTRSGRDRRAERLRDGSMVDDLRFDLLADELPAVR